MTTVYIVVDTATTIIFLFFVFFLLSFNVPAIEPTKAVWC